MLTQSEWMKILNTIFVVNSTQDINLMRKNFLESLSFLIVFEKAIFYLGEEITESFKMKSPVSLNCNKSFIEEYEKYYKEYDYTNPLINMHQSIAYKDSDLISKSQIEKSDFYKLFLGPNNVVYSGGLVIVKNGVYIGDVILYRTREQGDFSAKDLEILNLLKSHLENRLSQLVPIVQANISLKDHYVQLLNFQLTNREIEIIELSMNGLNYNEIGEKLCVSHHTVKKHFNNIFSKLNIHSRNQLTQFILNLENFTS